MLLRCESLDPSMSQTGHLQTFGEPNRVSALPLKADIRVTHRQLRRFDGAPEGHDLVVNVVPDVCATQPWNAGPQAPVAGDFLFVHSKVRFVRGDVAATAKHDARHSSDLGVTGDVK